MGVRRVEITPGRPGDDVLGDVAMRMRQADVDELQHLSRREPYEALRLSVDSSDEVYAVTVDGVPVAAFGVAPVVALGRVGAPWFLGTDEVADHPREFVRGGRRAVHYWLGRYTLLANTVSGRNELSKRWLARVGFELAPAHTVNGAPAHHFWARGGTTCAT